MSAAPAEPIAVDPQRSVTGNGRREWFWIARRQLEEHRASQQRPIARDRDDRLLDCAWRFEQNLQVELAANQAYERWRAGAVDRRGRRLHGNGMKPYVAVQLPEGQVNVSDPDSRVMRTQGTPPRQAYNAQAAVNDRQIILAAEVTVDAADFGRLEPMLDVTLRQLKRHNVSDRPDVVLADAGYWPTAQMQHIRDRGIEVLAPPDGNMREGTRPGWEGGAYQQMRDTLKTDRGRQLYAQRKITIEPVFGQIKHNRHIERFTPLSGYSDILATTQKGCVSDVSRSVVGSDSPEPQVAWAARVWAPGLAGGGTCLCGAWR